MIYSKNLHSSFKKFGLLLTLTSTIMSFSACNNSINQNTDSGKITKNLRLLSQSERAQDFDQLINLFKTYYGPYDYKERNLNINIEKEALRLKDLAVNAKTDEEFAGYVMQLGALLKDGHVQIGIQNTSSGISRYRIPVLVSQIEDKTIIVDLAKDLSNELPLEIGDEVLEVDGKTPQEYMPIFKKYEGWATEESEKHAIYALFSRPSYMTEAIPQTQMARIKLKKADGSIYVQEIPWTVRKYNEDLDKLIKIDSNKEKPLLNLKFNRADEINQITSHVGLMGDENPFFYTPQVKKVAGLIKVYPSDESLKKAGLSEKEKPPIFAAIYKYQNKNILIVRNATYSPSDFKSSVYLKAYKALLTEFQPMADVLVLDQTHNPGGSYCDQFYNLFAKKMDVQAVQQCNADRKWINDLKIKWPNQISSIVPWDARITEVMGLTVEKAYDAGKRLSDPIALFTSNTNVVEDGVWEKPMLVLIDELAGSCGDIFPMLIKANKRAKLFGQKTMGLGGNVEEVGVLNNSRISIRMTRGLFSPYKENADYTDKDLVENNGVTPDIEYAITLKDFRSGYLNYIKAFSDAAVAEIKDSENKAAAPSEDKKLPAKLESVQ